MIKGFGNFDPPREKKLACHSDLPEWACKEEYKEPKCVMRQAIGDLVVIAFY